MFNPSIIASFNADKTFEFHYQDENADCYECAGTYTTKNSFLNFTIERIEGDTVASITLTGKIHKNEIIFNGSIILKDNTELTIKDKRTQALYNNLCVRQVRYKDFTPC